jgi:basic membrane lipoprotein Med (substrate-binding protein (PBP1-ABC) superfamily)
VVKLSTKRRWWLVAAATVVVLAGLAAWIWWPRPAPPRARQYLAFTACLLTDGQGLAGSPAHATWSGMQDASLATRAKVEYLAVPGHAGQADALPYVTSLVQRRCDVVLAVGTAQVTAVTAVAPRYPHTHFVTIGGNAVAVGNVSNVTAGSTGEIHDRVNALVTGFVRAGQ